MTPIQHPMCNDVLRKPAGMTEDECRDLHIHRDDTAVWSFWKPNPEEMLALNRGGAVALIVMGATHPPLSIMATHPTEPQEPRPVDESEYRHRIDALNDRLNALVALTKQIVASWTSNTDDSPKRRGLIDRFLDLLNANKTDGSLVDTVPADEPAAITQTDVDRYRADSEGWKAEAERFELRLREVATALGDDWNVMPPDQAITAIKTRLAMAEAARDEWARRAKNATMTDGKRTFDAGRWMNECLNAERERDAERELRKVIDQSMVNLLHYVDGRPGDVPVAGPAVVIRDALIEHNRRLAALRVLVTDTNPNPAEG